MRHWRVHFGSRFAFDDNRVLVLSLCLGLFKGDAIFISFMFRDWDWIIGTLIDSTLVPPA